MQSFFAETEMNKKENVSLKTFKNFQWAKEKRTDNDNHSVQVNYVSFADHIIIIKIKFLW